MSSKNVDSYVDEQFGIPMAPAQQADLADAFVWCARNLAQISFRENDSGLYVMVTVGPEDSQCQSVAYTLQTAVHNIKWRMPQPRVTTNAAGIWRNG